jgi:hypothetical protein
MKSNEETTLVVQVGNRYRQRNTALRVVSHDKGCVLLEQWVDGELNQYIVTNGLYLHDGELHWNGSGEYFPCKYPGICDTPFEALRKALDHMEPRKVCVLISETDVGVFTSVHSSMEKAKAALQHLLDNNYGIQSAAAGAGIDYLTADMYLNGVLPDCDTIHVFYSVEERTLDYND